MTAGDHLDILTAEARYHRQRYDLYRARTYGPRPTSEARLRELARLCEAAEARLQAAKRAARHGRTDSDEPPG